jgi:PucR C-terminal helix-turn-helix domain
MNVVYRAVTPDAQVVSEVQDTSAGIRPAVQPWTDLPAWIADVMRPHLDRRAAEIIQEIQRAVPEYARPLDDNYVRALQLGVERALHQFVERVANPRASWEPVANVYREIGRCEAREGRSLDALQAAMRVGGRVAWRRLIDDVAHLNLSNRTLGRLGEAIFIFLDEMGTASAEGYAEAQARFAGELERRRRRLLDLLLAGRPASPDAVAALARAARWQLPRTVAAVALDEPEHGDTGAPLLPPDVLVDLNRREPCLLVPDPDGPGRQRMLDLAVRGWDAAVGPTVPLADAAKSLRWAEDALALAREGVIVTAGGVIRCAEHLSTLVVFRDPELLRALAAARLAPLARLRPAQQERLAETLLAWLQTAHNTNDVALRLHVHPQTVRYRLRQLEELFGDRLHDPETRFELEIALRARRGLATAGVPAAGAGGGAGSLPAPQPAHRTGGRGNGKVVALQAQRRAR